MVPYTLGSQVYFAIFTTGLALSMLAAGAAFAEQVGRPPPACPPDGVMVPIGRSA